MPARCPPACSLTILVRTAASVVISIFALSAVPYQTSAKPVLWVSNPLREPSALGRSRPVSMRVRQLVAVLVHDPGSAHVVAELPPFVREDAFLTELERVDPRVVAVPGVCSPATGAQSGCTFSGSRRHRFSCPSRRACRRRPAPQSG
jgi:hypothetical protein